MNEGQREQGLNCGQKDPVQCIIDFHFYFGVCGGREGGGGGNQIPLTTP